MPILHSLKDDDEASQMLASVEGIGSLLGRSPAVDAGAFRYTGENILGKYCSTLGHSLASYPGSFSRRKEPGNIGGVEPLLPACHHSCDKRRTLLLLW